MEISAICPLCERPAKYEQIGFTAPKRHYQCACSEFLVDDTGASALSAYGEVYNRNIITNVKVYSDADHICVINITVIGASIDIVLGKVLRAEALR